MPHVDPPRALTERRGVSSQRRLGLALALGTVAVAMFVTQWPFEYRFTTYAVELRWTRIDWRWFPRDRAGDIRFDRDFAQNLLMLMPLGVGFALWRRTAYVRVVIEALVLGIVTSAVLELAQLVTRYRYTSFPDLWRNSLGCMIGAMAVIALQRSLSAPRA